MAPLRSFIRAQVCVLVTSLQAALRMDAAWARDALRAGACRCSTIEENGAVYAECDNAAERLLLAVGGVSMESGCEGIWNLAIRTA